MSFKMIIFKLLLFFFIIVHVNGDVESDIRMEEEKRHNATLATYLKAALSGALLSIFPKVTEQERVEAEKILAHVYPLGDPSRPFPDNEEKIEINLCRNHRERGKLILAYARKRWPTHLITQISIRLAIHAVGDKNDFYCKDAANRNMFTKNAPVINSHINEINVFRNKYIDNMMLIAYGNNSIHKLAVLCCSCWTFKEQSVNVLANAEAKLFLTDYIDGYVQSALKYLCVHHSEGSKACANLVIPPPPTNYPRFTSVIEANIEVLSKITSISP